MKTTKKIMFVLASLMLSCVSAFAIGNFTECLPFGIGAGALGFVTSVMTMTHPHLAISRFAFDLINPSQLTWNGKEVMDMQSAVFEAVYKNPDLTMTNIIVEDIVAQQQIAFLGLLSKITKKNAGCGSSPSTNNIPLRQQFWMPVATEFWLQECATNLEATFFVWGLNKGIDRFDLTAGDFATFVMERMETALGEDILRIVWFNDTDAENYNGSPAGVITNGVSLTDYNIIDGLWKKLFAVVSADATKNIPIPNNALAAGSQGFTTADVTNRVVTNILGKMKKQADTRLTDSEDTGLFFLVTKSVYDQYEDELTLSYNNITDAWMMLQNGVKTLSYKGIPLIKMSFWDRTIAADFQDPTGKYYLPHRILLTVKENIPIGVDAKSELGKTESWYFPQDKTTNWRGGYKVDTQVLEPYMVMTGY